MVALLVALAATAFADASLSSSSHLLPSRLVQSRVAAPVIASAREEDDIASACLAAVERLRGGEAAKCNVILVGCGLPKRGMGWYHAKQMLEGDVPSATLSAVVEPWFLGPGSDSPPGETFKAWADDMAAKHGTKFVKDISELDIKV
jgi:hypothetical protein